MRVLTVIGNRPQFVKAAAVSRLLRAEHDELLVHTGQHHDDELSTIFVTERSITADELPGVREAFLASTVREVLPVHAIDGRAVPTVEGRLTRDADARVRALIAQELGAAAR